jgi:hypothetical protein
MKSLIDNEAIRFGLERTSYVLFSRIQGRLPWKVKGIVQRIQRGVNIKLK